MFPVGGANFFATPPPDFRAMAAIKQQQRLTNLTNLTNLTLVCSYRSSCLDFSVALVECQVEGCSRRLHHVCWGEYMLLNGFDFDGGERKICRDCVDELGGGERVRGFEEGGR